MDKKVPSGQLDMTVDPKAEWKQIFTDAWRLERDFFYDRHMHGVDWAAMRKRYAGLLDLAVTRSDVNVVIGELIGELNASHTYRGGGDEEVAPMRAVGYLGIDWEVVGRCIPYQEDHRWRTVGQRGSFQSRHARSQGPGRQLHPCRQRRTAGYASCAVGCVQGVGGSDR